MRRAAIALLALVAVPLVLDAQELPNRIRRPRPTAPTDLPPQAPSVAKYLNLKRARFAVESYPLFSIVHAPLFPGAGSQSVFTSVGGGAQLGYRVSQHFLGTLDLTSTAVGSSVNTQSMELGARLQPDRFESRTRPFADARLGYMRMFGHAVTRSDGLNEPSVPGTASYGVAAIVGAGLHHDLSPSFSLLTSASVLRGQLTTDGPVATPRSFPMTAFRLSVGLRYNRVHHVLAQDPNAR